MMVEKKSPFKVTVTENGPYLVTGGLPLMKEIIVFDENEGCPASYAQGEKYETEREYALCRCGGSGHKPFCDGTHGKIGFDGKETALMEKYMDMAGSISGKDIELLDYPDLCARARFCHRAGGIWDLVEGQKDEKTKDLAIEIAGQCPTGRLVILDKKTGKTVEPWFKPSISLLEDPEKTVSGGIWLKGGVLFESEDGQKYETRNRVVLCRCGKSDNKPYCDGSHIDMGFDDGDQSLKK